MWKMLLEVLKPSNISSDIYRHRKEDFEDQVRPIAAG